MSRINLIDFKAYLQKSWKGILQVTLILILSVIFYYYFSILAIKGWDFPVYLNSVYNSMQTPFSQSFPIRNSILYTFVFILDNFFVKDSILSLKVLIFIISIFTIISLFVFSKQISKYESRFKFRNVFSLLVVFYLFSPLFLELTVLYKQYLLMLFFLLSLIFIFQIFLKFGSRSLVSYIPSFICLAVLLLLSNLSSVLSLLSTLSLLFLPIVFLLKKSEEISKQKLFIFVLIYSGIFYSSIILGDLFAFFAFQNGSSQLSMLSPFSFSLYVGISRILGSIGIMINHLNPFLIVSIFSLIIILIFVGVFYLLLILKLNRKLDYSKFLNYFTISMIVLHLLLSLIFINERGDAYPGYQFSFYYLWGGFFVVHLLLYYSNNNCQKETSLFENGFLILISFLFVILNIIKVLQVLGGGSFIIDPGTSMTEEYIAFPLGRIYLFLLIPLSIISIFKLKKIKSFKGYFVNLVVTYAIISLILLIQIPITYIANLQIYEIYREINQISRLSRIGIWLVLLLVPNISIVGRISGNLSKRAKLFRNRGKEIRNFLRKIRNKINDSKKPLIYETLVVVLIIVQVVSTIGIGISLPSVILDHEMQFIGQIDSIIDENSTIAVAFHQTQWFILLASTNSSVLSINQYPKEIDETYQAVNLTLIFISDPSNETLIEVLDDVGTSLYLWISTNPRYLVYAPFVFEELIEFKAPILTDVDENNYLFHYEI